MKKALRLLMAALIILSNIACFAPPAAASDISDLFGYKGTNLSFSGNSAEVNGYFYNDNSNVEITEITSLTLTLYDNNGQAFAEVDFDDSKGRKNISIKPNGGKLNHTFIFSNLNNDPNSFDLSRWRVGMSCKFKYRTVSGGSNTNSNSSNNSDRIKDNISYKYTDLDIQSGKVVISGYFLNNNTDVDIYNIRSFSLVLSDKNKTKIFDASYKDGGNLQKIVVSAGSRTDFSFSVNVRVDKSKFDLSTTNLRTSYTFSYRDAKKSNSNSSQSPNSTPRATVAPATPIPAYIPPPQLPKKVQVDCPYGRDGKKHCTTCGGDGQLETLRGSIWGEWCRTCTGTGRMICVNCGGMGYTERWMY